MPKTSLDATFHAAVHGHGLLFQGSSAEASKSFKRPRRSRFSPADPGTVPAPVPTPVPPPEVNSHSITFTLLAVSFVSNPFVFPCSFSQPSSAVSDFEVEQVRKATGIQDESKLRSALKVLRAMDPKFVSSLGSLDPNNLRNLVLCNPVLLQRLVDNLKKNVSDTSVITDLLYSRTDR